MEIKFLSLDKNSTVNSTEIQTESIAPLASLKQSHIEKTKKPNSLFDYLAAVDANISELEDESNKTQKGLFAKTFNLFSSKDNQLNENILNLKNQYNSVIEEANLKLDALEDLNNNYKESINSLETYKKSKKSVADTTSTAIAITSGIAAGVSTAGLGTLGGLAASASLSGVSKVISKESMLGSEYNAWGKEGLYDGAISAGFTVTGNLASSASSVVAGKISQLIPNEKMAEGLTFASGIGIRGIKDLGMAAAMNEEVRNGNTDHILPILLTSAISNTAFSKINPQTIAGQSGISITKTLISKNKAEQSPQSNTK